MKIEKILWATLLITLIGCYHKKEQINHFTSFNDTIVLETVKIKGLDIFSAGAGQLYFFDTTELYKYKVFFPENIKQLKIAYQIIDFKKFDYEAFHSKSTWNDSLIKNNSICIISGLKDNDTIFIVDENNNKDFRDDSIRLYQKIEWKSTLKLIKSKYLISDGEKLINDSSWVNIGTSDGNELLFFVSHHLESTFSIDNETYQIGIIDKQFNYTFDEPYLTLLTQNGIRKDTLIESELLRKGEYLKLKDIYYCFDSISNDGKYIILIKEKDFNNKIGTQVGMIAPEFKCITINGDILNSIDLHKNKSLLIANISGCYPKAYELIKEVNRQCRDSLNIIWLEYEVDSQWQGRIVDLANDFNKELYLKYRNAYSSDYSGPN